MEEGEEAAGSMEDGEEAAGSMNGALNVPSMSSAAFLAPEEPGEVVG